MSVKYDIYRILFCHKNAKNLKLIGTAVPQGHFRWALVCGSMIALNKFSFPKSTGTADLSAEV